MLRIAQLEGINHIIATPHYRAGRRNPDKEELLEKLLLVRQEARKINDSFQIDLGNEIYYSHDILEDLDHKKALTLADTRYVLIEFHESESYLNLRKGLYQLLLKGYLPILAHVERYQCLYKSRSYMNELIQLGIYLQVNMSGIIGCRIDRKISFCRKLLGMGWVHFIATDAHTDGERAPRMREGASYLRKKYGEELMNQLLRENQKRLLLNEYL
jgi:protein-tyrosine phosphatase